MGQLNKNRKNKNSNNTTTRKKEEKENEKQTQTRAISRERENIFTYATSKQDRTTKMYEALSSHGPNLKIKGRIQISKMRYKIQQVPSPLLQSPRPINSPG